MLIAVCGIGAVLFAATISVITNDGRNIVVSIRVFSVHHALVLVAACKGGEKGSPNSPRLLVHRTHPTRSATPARVRCKASRFSRACRGQQPRRPSDLETGCMFGDTWQGTLRGFDQTTNLIIEDCHERVFSTMVRFQRACRVALPCASAGCCEYNTVQGARSRSASL